MTAGDLEGVGQQVDSLLPRLPARVEDVEGRAGATERVAALGRRSAPVSTPRIQRATALGRDAEALERGVGGRARGEDDLALAVEQAHRQAHRGRQTLAAGPHPRVVDELGVVARDQRDARRSGRSARPRPRPGPGVATWIRSKSALGQRLDRGSAETGCRRPSPRRRASRSPPRREAPVDAAVGADHLDVEAGDRRARGSARSCGRRRAGSSIASTTSATAARPPSRRVEAAPARRRGTRSPAA